MSGPRPGARIAAGLTAAILILLPLILAACVTQPSQPLQQPNVPPPGFFPNPPASEQGGLVAALYPWVFVIAVAVFVLVEGLLLIIVLRFRRHANDETLPTQTHGNNFLEVLWTAIPALIVTGLFVVTVNTLNQVDAVAADEPAVVIDVTGFQWQWTFDYPKQGDLSFTGTGATGPVLVLPTNETVRIRLHSKDVIHSFYVPAFLYKKDVIPGRTNEFDVKVDQVGTYSGQCAEFCGLGHADMQFTVQAMTRSDFDNWVTDEHNKASQTPSPAPSGSATVEIHAINTTTFQPGALTAPANVPIQFNFHNDDQTQPHDIAIENVDGQGNSWAGQPIAQPGQTATYVAPALAPGTYTFFCAVHPTTMRGTLTVTP